MPIVIEPNILDVITHDGVICYPTEGVWGLGCHPQSEVAFETLLTIKKRPQDKGVILVASSLAQLEPYIAITSDVKALFEQHADAFVTFVLPSNPLCPQYLKGQFDTLAVRITNHAPLKALCEEAGTALVSTSANLTGKPTVKTIDEARALFGSSVSGYVDQPLGGMDKPSTILSWCNNTLEVIRE